MQLLRKIAFPFSLVYSLVVRIRNFLFDTGVLSSKSFTTPTICVGNLSVGGTGKTPMVEYLIGLLQMRHRVAVLSRGYKRRSKGFVLASAGSGVEDLGDEPYQIYAKFPAIAVAVDADRQHGISVLEQTEKPGLIILDDALQHRRVEAGLNILLTAYGKLYTDDWCLPTGNLRDNRREAKRAKVIIVTKCPPDLSGSEKGEITKKLKPEAHQKVFFSCLDYDNMAKGTEGKTEPMHFFMEKKASLVTGIADPMPLVDHLKKQGVVLNHFRFRDHHFFTEAELKMLDSEPCILTTEKDFVRLKGKIKNLYYIQVKHRFLNGGASLLEEELEAFMRQGS